MHTPYDPWRYIENESYDPREESKSRSDKQGVTVFWCNAALLNCNAQQEAKYRDFLVIHSICSWSIPVYSGKNSHARQSSGCARANQQNPTVRTPAPTTSQANITRLPAGISTSLTRR